MLHRKEVTPLDNYNYSKLLGRMKECQYTQRELSKVIGISEGSLIRKLKNKGQFGQDEIMKISIALDIPLSQCEQYFFAH